MSIYDVLWLREKNPAQLYGVQMEIVLHRTDTKLYGQKEPDYSIYLGIAALWINREKLKEAKLLWIFLNVI